MENHFDHQNNSERPTGLPQVPFMEPISTDISASPPKTPDTVPETPTPAAAAPDPTAPDLRLHEIPDDEYTREMRKRRERRLAAKAGRSDGFTYDNLSGKRPSEDLNMERDLARRRAERDVFKRHRSFQVFMLRFVMTLLWVVALGMIALTVYTKFVLMPKLRSSGPNDALWESANILDLFPAVTESIFSGAPLTLDESGHVVVSSSKYIKDITDPESWFFGNYELPLNGAAGYASVDMILTNSKGETVGSCSAGDSFTILSDDGTYLEVMLTDGTRGLLNNRYCMINLPDVIPSIIYCDSNSDSSVFRSMGYDLPGITGEKLYEAQFANERLDCDQYAMPVLYSMAAKIAAAQKAALEYGYTLKIYETYRPYDVQMQVASTLLDLMNTNSEVNRGINTPPWSKSWFIAQTLSNHQSGCAMDVTLAKVTRFKEEILTAESGQEFPYLKITNSEECVMPTDMHELSSLACVFKQAVDSKSRDAWRACELADSMTDEAVFLQLICTDAGLSPLASEWWHFNDLDARDRASGNRSGGRYFLKENLSAKPGIK